MGSESIAHETERPNGLLTQAMRARGIIAFVKSNYLVKNIEKQKILAT